MGTYEISQRTHYSKIRIYDLEKDIDIAQENPQLYDEITEDFRKQFLNAEHYFDISFDKIVSVKESFFKDDLKYIFIPDGITKILDCTFANLDIISISLPDSLESIGNRAFLMCRNLISIDIPDSVKKIGNTIFKDCCKLRNVKLPSNIKELPNNTFDNCKSLEKINIPNSMNLIDTSAFMDCISLTDVKLSKNIKTISTAAFYGCKQLTNIDLPEGLQNIGGECFSYCTSLKEIIIPDSVSRINGSTFVGCENLEHVKMSNQLNVLEYGMFDDCTKLNSIFLPDNITKLSSILFNSVKSLNNINIPKNLKEIEGAPFANNSIKSLTFNYDLKELNSNHQKYDLLYNSGINKLVINKFVKIITPNAFCVAGAKITSIDYLGSKEQFEEFKNNNKALFDILPNIKEINFLEKSLAAPEIELLH